jgi:hypothetical protein
MTEAEVSAHEEKPPADKQPAIGGAANLIAGAGPDATTELRRLKASNKSSSIFSASLAASQGTTPAERRARRVGISWSQGQIGIERIVSSPASADPVIIITESLSTASTPPAPQKGAERRHGHLSRPD